MKKTTASPVAALFAAALALAAPVAAAGATARIGDVEFDTLDSAIAAAKGGDTVVLLDAATLGVDIGVDITIDAAGHDLVVYGGGDARRYIDGSVVFKNSLWDAADPTAHGTFNVTCQCGLTPYTGGSLTIESGHYVQETPGWYLFYLMGGTLVIDDGSFDAAYCVVNTYVRDNRPVPGDGWGGTVVVNGGQFSVREFDGGNGDVQAVFIVNQCATAVINGGTANAGGGRLLVDNSEAKGGLVGEDYGTSVTVNGGSFTGGRVVSKGENASLTVADGTFSEATFSADADAELSISGGLFDAAVPEEYCAEGYVQATETVEIDGKTYYAVARADIPAPQVASLAVDGGVAVLTLGATLHGAWYGVEAQDGTVLAEPVQADVSSGMTISFPMPAGAEANTAVKFRVFAYDENDGEDDSDGE